LGAQGSGPLGGSTFSLVDINVKLNCAAAVGGVLGATRAARRAESLRPADRPLLETGFLLRQTWRLTPCGELVERVRSSQAGPAVEGWRGKQSALFAAQLCRGAGARSRAYGLTTPSNIDIGGSAECETVRPPGRGDPSSDPAA